MYWGNPFCSHFVDLLMVILKNPLFIVSANCDEIAKEAFIIETLQPDAFFVNNWHTLHDKVSKQG